MTHQYASSTNNNNISVICSSSSSFIKQSRSLQALVRTDCSRPYINFFQIPTSNEEYIKQELEYMIEKIRRQAGKPISAIGGISNNNKTKNNNKFQRGEFQKYDSIGSLSFGTGVEMEILYALISELDRSGPNETLTTSEKALYTILKTSSLPRSSCDSIGNNNNININNNNRLSYNTEKRNPSCFSHFGAVSVNIAEEAVSRRHIWTMDVDPIVASSFSPQRTSRPPTDAAFATDSLHASSSFSVIFSSGGDYNNNNNNNNSNNNSNNRGAAAVRGSSWGDCSENIQTVYHMSEKMKLNNNNNNNNKNGGVNNASRVAGDRNNRLGKNDVIKEGAGKTTESEKKSHQASPILPLPFSFFGHSFLSPAAISALRLVIRHCLSGRSDPFFILYTTTLPTGVTTLQISREFLSSPQNLTSSRPQGTSSSHYSSLLSKSLNGNTNGTTTCLLNIMMEPLVDFCEAGNILLRLRVLIDTASLLELRCVTGSFGAGAVSGLRKALRVCQLELSRAIKPCVFIGTGGGQSEGSSSSAAAQYFSDIIQLSNIKETLFMLGNIFYISLEDDWRPTASLTKITSAKCLTHLLDWYTRASRCCCEYRHIDNYNNNNNNNDGNKENIRTPQQSSSFLALKILHIIVSSAIKPFYNLVTTWINQSQVVDPFSEFFIEQKIENWNFTLITDESSCRLPGFCSPEIAQKLLETGEARRILIQCAEELAETAKDDGDNIISRLVLNYLEAVSGQSPSVGPLPCASVDVTSVWEIFFDKCEALLLGVEYTVLRANEDELCSISSNEAEAISDLDEIVTLNTSGYEGDSIARGKVLTDYEADIAIQQERRETVRSKMLEEHERKMARLHRLEKINEWKIRRNRLQRERVLAYHSIQQDIATSLKNHQERLKLVETEEEEENFDGGNDDDIPSDKRGNGITGKKRRRASKHPLLVIPLPVELLEKEKRDNHLKLESAVVVAVNNEISLGCSDIICSNNNNNDDDDNSGGVATIITSDSITALNLASLCKESEKEEEKEEGGSQCYNEQPLSQEETGNMINSIEEKSQCSDRIAGLKHPREEVPPSFTKVEEEINEIIIPTKSQSHQNSNAEEVKADSRLSIALDNLKVFSLNDPAFHELVGIRSNAPREEAEKAVLEDFYKRERMLQEVPASSVYLAHLNKTVNGQANWDSFDDKEIIFRSCRSWGAEEVVGYQDDLLDLLSGDDGSNSRENISSTNTENNQEKRQKHKSNSGTHKTVSLSITSPEEHLKNLAQFLSQYFCRKTLQFLLMDRYGTVSNIIQGLNGICLMQDGNAADALMLKWAEATQSLSGEKRHCLPSSSSSPIFDVNIAFKNMANSFTDAWASQLCSLRLPLKLSLVDEQRGSLPRASNAFELLPLLTLKAITLHPNDFVSRLFPSNFIDRYSDLFVCLVFWKWVSLLLTQSWAVAMRCNLKQAWKFLIIAKGMLGGIAEFVWFQISGEVCQLSKLLKNPGDTNTNTIDLPNRNYNSTMRGNATTTITTNSRSRMDNNYNYINSCDSISNLTEDLDAFLERSFNGALLAPHYGRVRRQARVLVRIVEDVYDRTTKHAAISASRRPEHHNNVVEFIENKTREFTAMGSIFVKHLEGALSVSAERMRHERQGMKMEYLINLLRQVLNDS